MSEENSEVKHSIKNATSGKIPDPDEIPVEIFKALGDINIARLTHIIKKYMKKVTS